MIHQPEGRPKLAMQGLGIVAHHIEATALVGPFWAERDDNDVAAGFDCVIDLANVSQAVLRVCQEMEHRSVVPHIVPMLAEGE